MFGQRLGMWLGLLCCIPGLGQAATVRLGPDDVVQRILERNLNIQVAQTGVGMAEADWRGARGVFDFSLDATLQQQIDQSVRSAPAIFGSRSDTSTLSLGLGKKWPTGTETSISYGATRLETIGSAFTSPLLYSAQVGVGVRQPLLRNLAGRGDRAGIAAARAAFRVAEASLQTQIQDEVRAGLGAYWDWVLTLRQVGIAQQAVRAAQEFAAITEERRVLGTALETDTHAARANILSRQAAVLEAEAAVAAAAERLRIAIQLAAAASMAPRGTPLPALPTALAPARAITQALAARPDYQAAQHAVEAQAIQLQRARDATWPQLDLVSTLTFNQLVNSNLATALRGTDNPNWVVGVELQVPLPNRSARGARDRATHAKAQAVIRLKQLEDAMAQQITRLAIQLRQLAAEISLRDQAEKLQREKAALEQEQYRIGRSSSELVIRAHDDHAGAQLAALQARQRGIQTWLAYELARGALP